MESVLWLALISAGCLCLVTVTACPVSKKNTFVELDAQLLDRIELATEEIARNSTRDFVDYKIQAKIDLFIENLNITIVDRLKDISNNSLQKKIKSMMDKIQTTKRFIGNHVGHLKEVNGILKGLGDKLMTTLEVSNHSN
ncbi:hypothetical protein ACI65C_002439 [Semiaphis heraclei]